MDLTPYQADEIRKLQKIVKLYESMIAIFLPATFFLLIAWLILGFLSWFVDGIWGFEGLKLCSLVSMRGCQPFFSEIYAINFFLDWVFGLNVFIFCILICIVLLGVLFPSLYSRLDRIDEIRALAKAKVKNEVTAN
jgi:hypothetical protein